MKKIFFILTIAIATLTAQAQEAQENLKGTVKVEVDGLSCPFCAYGLEKNLKEVDGVENIKIDVENAYVLLTISKDKAVKEETIRQNIKDAGFTPKKIVMMPDKIS